MGLSKFLMTVVAIFLASLLATSSIFAQDAKTVYIQDNIYSIVSSEGIDSNSTFITTKEGVIVIDTRPTPIEAKKVLAEIRKKTDLPIIYAINTHYHGDHTFGNQVFNESKTIIAHRNVRKSLMGKRGEDHLAFFKTFGLPGTDEIKITPPNLVYEKGLNIYLGGFHLELIYSGRGHTDGDTFIYMPSLRTIITGDLVFNKKVPYMGDGYIEDWIRSLVLMENLDAEIIVPGHGEVGGKPLVTRMKHYLMELKTYVIQALADGKTLKETQDTVRPALEKKYSDWKKLEWLDDNIERAYYEFSAKKDT